jgi:hypothetical protein
MLVIRNHGLLPLEDECNESRLGEAQSNIKRLDVIITATQLTQQQQQQQQNSHARTARKMSFRPFG